MDSNQDVDLQALAAEIEPILHEVLSNSEVLCDFLKKKGVSKAIKLQMQLDTQKLRKTAIASRVQGFLAEDRVAAASLACTEYCESINRWVRCNTCPD